MGFETAFHITNGSLTRPSARPADIDTTADELFGGSFQSLQPGRGVLEVTRVGSRTAVTRVAATNPLKLLTPRRRTRAAWVYASTFGGGLVAGDSIEIDLRLRPNTECAISTQSSTKVYRSVFGKPCRQTLRAVIGENATLAVVPDPVTCFSEARYEQVQRFDLQAGAGLVYVDWLTSGRYARGERWAFSSYRSQLDIYVEDDLVIADALLLDPANGRLDSPFRLGRFNCLAVVVIIGKQFINVGEALLADVTSRQVDINSPLIDSVSPLKHGVIWRILGDTTEGVGRHVRTALDFLGEVLGCTPWLRKW